MVAAPRGTQEPAMQNHHPKIAQRPDRTWVVECPQCRNDLTSALPIGIGMPLRDRETAERLRENHATRSVRRAVAS
jgi:hypothetical protein